MKRRVYMIAALGLLLQLSAVRGEGRGRDLMKANYLYSHLAYHEAIPYYEKIILDNPNMTDAEVYVHLADCYRLTKQPAVAAEWYGKAAMATDLPTEAQLNYAVILMQLQRYDDAAGQLRKYQQAMPLDRRAGNMLQGCIQAQATLARIPEGVSTLVSFNTDGADFGPALNNNRLVFTTDSVAKGPRGKEDRWTGTPFYNIYGANCTMNGRCGTEYESLGHRINSEYHDGPATFSRDGGTIYFTRTTLKSRFLGAEPKPDSRGEVHLEIMIGSDYDLVGRKFRKVVPFRYNNVGYSTAHPAVSPDGNTMVFCSDKPGGEGGTDLYMSRRAGDGNWLEPVNVGKELNTEGLEQFPNFIDNQTISFASNGHQGLGGLDVFYATWNEQTQSWGGVTNAGLPVNSSYDDMSLSLYADQQNGYFASNRPADRANDNIYHFFRQKIYLSLKIQDSFSNRSLQGAVVSLQSAPDKRTLIADGAGEVITTLYPQAKYDITITKPGYRPALTALTTTGITGPHDTLEGLVSLTPDITITYSGVVLDEQTRQPVEDPAVVLTKDGGQASDTVHLRTGENYLKNLDPGSTYHIYAVKDLYYSNEKTISTLEYQSGGQITIKDTIYLKKLQVGVAYKIDNIYYDYDKATIREDAKPALNQLLMMLQQHPNMTIQLNSHTDCRGTDAYNERLSAARAQSVVKYLESRGIRGKRMKSKGFGESMPVDSCNGNCEGCSEAQHQQNRRTEFQIMGM